MLLQAIRNNEFEKVNELLHVCDPSLNDNEAIRLAVTGKTNIVEVLLKGEKCACEIPNLVERTQSNTSMHLAKLQDWGIIQSRRDGKKILYSIKDKRVCDILNILGKR